MYKEAALNPTNLRDRTVEWEADVVNVFRSNAAKAEFVGRRETATGQSVFLGAPIKVDDDSCLACHGRPEDAPADLVKLYGKSNGFGWKSGEVIGAQIVSIPSDIPKARANHAVNAISALLGGVFGVLYFVFNVIAFVFIARAAPKELG